MSFCNPFVLVPSILRLSANCSCYHHSNLEIRGKLKVYHLEQGFPESPSAYITIPQFYAQGNTFVFRVQFMQRSEDWTTGS
jgi:hypothetical protein